MSPVILFMGWAYSLLVVSAFWISFVGIAWNKKYGPSASMAEDIEKRMWYLTGMGEID